MAGDNGLVTAEELDGMVQFIGSTSASDAAFRIINGIDRGRTRILIGTDCKIVDLLVRLMPRGIYMDHWLLPLNRVCIGLTMVGVRFLGRWTMGLFLLFLLWTQRLRRAAALVVAWVYLSRMG